MRVLLTLPFMTAAVIIGAFTRLGDIASKFMLVTCLCILGRPKTISDPAWLYFRLVRVINKMSGFCEVCEARKSGLPIPPS